MKKTLFCLLLSGALFAFSSCRSDELTAYDGEQSALSSSQQLTGSQAVQFVSNRVAPNRTYYDSNGNMGWSISDNIRILSPVPATPENDDQYAIYTVGEDSGSAASGIFNYVEHSSFPNPIQWNNDVMQHFYAYYPSESVGANPAASSGAITDIDPATGAASFHFPADQSLTAGMVPASSEHDKNPLSYAIAVTHGVTVNTASSVVLAFSDFANVLRIHIKNQAGAFISGVKISSTGSPVAGSVNIVPPAAPSIGDLDGTIVSPLELIYNILSSQTSNEIIATHAVKTGYESGGTGDLYYDIHMLPQAYVPGSLKITVLVGADDAVIDENNDFTRTIPSTFATGSMKSVMLIPDRVNMGRIGDIDNNGAVEGDLHFAIGNLIVTYNAVPLIQFPTTPDGYYIAGTQPNKSQYAANNALSGLTFLNRERDLFKIGEIDAPSYWLDDATFPTMGSYDDGDNFSGDSDYDLASNVLHSEWRTPTQGEWNALANTTNYVWTWQNDYRGVSGMDGYLVSTKPGTTPGILSTTPVASVFLPAAGYHFIPTTLSRGNNGYYWSSTVNTVTKLPIVGTILSSSVDNLYFSNGSHSIGSSNTAYSLAVRPVTDIKSEP